MQKTDVKSLFGDQPEPLLEQHDQQKNSTRASFSETALDSSNDAAFVRPEDLDLAQLQEDRRNYKPPEPPEEVVYELPATLRQASGFDLFAERSGQDEENGLMPVAEALVTSSSRGKLSIHEQAVIIVENQIEQQRIKQQKRRYCIALTIIAVVISLLLLHLYKQTHL